MKHIKHNFVSNTGSKIGDEMLLYIHDFCIYCNKTAMFITKKSFNYLDFSPLIVNSRNDFVKCLTEDEFTIKRLLE